VQGKGYDLSRELASAYFGDLIQRMLGHTVGIDLAGPWNRQGPVFGDPRLAPQRLGQQAFKARVLVAHGKLRALHYAGTEWAGEGRCDPN
jgi:putative restriction endonuclease